LKFLPSLPAGTIGYQLTGNAGGDTWQTITVLFNGTGRPASLPVPAGSYKVVLRGLDIKPSGLATLTPTAGKVTVPSSTALILVQ
jgi:pullulanase